MRAHLATLVEDFRRHSAETAVVAHRGNRRYATTYGELALLAGRFAAELERRGVGPGERVVLWGENSAEWIGVFFGCMLRGVIAVPLDAAGTAEFAARVIGDTRPRLVVGDGDLLGQIGFEVRGSRFEEGARFEGGRGEMRGALRRAQGRLPHSAVKRSGRDDASPNSLDSPQVAMLALGGIGEQLPAEPLFAVSEAVGAQTPFQIVFTSGTTSEPRGIVHTHRNILVTLEPIEREMQKYLRYERWFHPLRFLQSLPLSHVFGQFMALWVPGLLAAEVHFSEHLEPSRVVELIRRERVSVLIAVPRVLQLLRVHLESRFEVRGSGFEGKGESTGQLRTVLEKWWRYRRVHRALGWKFWAVISGGATLPAELEAFWNRLGYALIQGYGMTETAALVTLNHPFHIKEGTIGKPMPGHEVKLTDEGEILVRGEMLTEATWQAGAMHRREGEWLATGDLAEANETGELRFVGRKGDVIVTGAGMNVHPADLERALAAQAGVRGAVVVGCEMAGGAGSGETGAVAVVLFAGTAAELDAAVAAANRGLAEYQQIRRVVRWPELEFPYTSTGKLLRRKVAEWACGAVAGRQQSGAALAQDALVALIAEVTGEAVAAGGDVDALRLSEDLHLDSLGRVQLQSALEQRFQVELEDDAVATVATVGELRGLMGRELAESAAGANARVRVGGGEEFRESAVSDAVVQGEDGEGKMRGSLHSALERSGRDDASFNNGPEDTDWVRRDGASVKGREDAGEHVYPRWPWWWWVQGLRVVWVECVMRPLVWLLAAPRVRYVDPTLRKDAKDGAPGLGGPLLIVCNHVTYYDGALVLYALPGRLRRHVAAAMSGEMLMDYRKRRGQPNALLDLLAPAAYWLLTALFNVFPLPRARGFRRSFAHAGEAMDRGYSVLIFPEGTRSQTGQMNAFRPGIGLLAAESRVPILPVAIRGLGEIQAEHARWFRSGRIEVRVGELIPAADDATDPAELTARLERAVRALR